jgi:hypothetical protein
MRSGKHVIDDVSELHGLGQHRQRRRTRHLSPPWERETPETAANSTSEFSGDELARRGSAGGHRSLRRGVGRRRPRCARAAPGTGLPVLHGGTTHVARWPSSPPTVRFRPGHDRGPGLYRPPGRPRHGELGAPREGRSRAGARRQRAGDGARSLGRRVDGQERHHIEDARSVRAARGIGQRCTRGRIV